MHEHLGFKAAFGRRGGNRGDLVQRQLPRKDHARKAHHGKLPCAVRAVHAHLCGAVQQKPRREPPHQRSGGKILHDHGVRSGGGDLGNGAGQRGQLVRVDDGIQRRVHPHAARMAKRNGIP